MKRQRLILIVFSFLCIISAPLMAYAYGGGISTAEMPKDTQDSFIETACINVFDTEPEKRKIISFDVNENGLIAIGTEINNNKCICIYTENMVLQYGINFICYGSFGFEWNGDDIEIYFVRNNTDVIVDRYGNIKSIRAYSDDIESNNYFNNVLNITERNIDGAKYTLKPNSDKFDFFKPYSFPILSITKPGEEEKILYDVSDEYFVTDTMQSFFDILIVVFVLSLLSVSVAKFIKKYKKTKAEKERAWQQILMQSDENTKDQK